MKEKKNTEKKYWLKPEEDFGRIGVVIGKEREMAGFSSRGVSDGLCSESSLRRLEQGEMGCEKVLADALLERMGVSPSRMLFYLSLKEEEYLQSRENWIQEIRQGHCRQQRNIKTSIRSRQKSIINYTSNFPC